MDFDAIDPIAADTIKPTRATSFIEGAQMTLIVCFNLAPYMNLARCGRRPEVWPIGAAHESGVYRHSTPPELVGRGYAPVRP